MTDRLQLPYVYLSQFMQIRAHLFAPTFNYLKFLRPIFGHRDKQLCVSKQADFCRAVADLLLAVHKDRQRNVIVDRSKSDEYESKRGC